MCNNQEEGCLEVEGAREEIDDEFALDARDEHFEEKKEEDKEIEEDIESDKNIESKEMEESEEKNNVKKVKKNMNMKTKTHCADYLMDNI